MRKISNNVIIIIIIIIIIDGRGVTSRFVPLSNPKPSSWCKMEGAWISVVEARWARLALDLVADFGERLDFWLQSMWWARRWEARLANRRGQLPLQ